MVLRARALIAVTFIRVPLAGFLDKYDLNATSNMRLYHLYYRFHYNVIDYTRHISHALYAGVCTHQHPDISYGFFNTCFPKIIISALFTIRCSKFQFALSLGKAFLFKHLSRSCKLSWRFNVSIHQLSVISVILGCESRLFHN